MYNVFDRWMFMAKGEMNMCVCEYVCVCMCVVCVCVCVCTCVCVCVCVCVFFHDDFVCKYMYMYAGIDLGGMQMYIHIM